MKTEDVVKVVTAVAIKTIPSIIASRAAIKAAKAERKIYEEIIASRSVTPKTEPIRVECERLA